MNCYNNALASFRNGPLRKKMRRVKTLGVGGKVPAFVAASSGNRRFGGNQMLGLMQDWPLLIHKIIDHAGAQHGRREIVSRAIEGFVHRTNYGTLRHRSLQVAKRLTQDGIVKGDRIATMAWNTWRHLEGWYGITGIGAIYHT